MQGCQPGGTEEPASSLRGASTPSCSLPGGWRSRKAPEKDDTGCKVRFGRWIGNGAPSWCSGEKRAPPPCVLPSTAAQGKALKSKSRAVVES